MGGSGAGSEAARTASPPAGRSRNLVVVRAGDSSLHPRWFVDADAADFDLIVSYYGDDPARFRSPRENRVDCKGGKWNGVAALFAERPELLDRYDFFWLSDDDLETDARIVGGLFAAMARFDLTLAQPSLEARQPLHLHRLPQQPNLRATPPRSRSWPLHLRLACAGRSADAPTPRRVSPPACPR